MLKHPETGSIGYGKACLVCLVQSIMGPDALGWDPTGFDPDNIRRTRSWLRSRGNSIEGGTSEVQLNIIAKRVLGLPEGS